VAVFWECWSSIWDLLGFPPSGSGLCSLYFSGRDRGTSRRWLASFGFAIYSSINFQSFFQPPIWRN
jgi:hypothetical protein